MNNVNILYFLTYFELTKFIAKIFVFIINNVLIKFFDVYIWISKSNWWFMINLIDNMMTLKKTIRRWLCFVFLIVRFVDVFFFKIFWMRFRSKIFNFLNLWIFFSFERCFFIYSISFSKSSKYSKSTFVYSMFIFEKNNSIFFRVMWFFFWHDAFKSLNTCFIFSHLKYFFVLRNFVRMWNDNLIIMFFIALNFFVLNLFF